jgi:RNA polymerase sigma-70 factor (ECF subfamily)
MDDFEISDELRLGAQRAWARYVDALAPFRPELHGYCRALTGDLWDAEDLVQDTVLKGFATLGSVLGPIRDSRAYLVRIATHFYIEGMRRGALEAERGSSEGSPLDAQLRSLAAQERAALVLSERFALGPEEIAEHVSLSAGTVRAAQLRGRERVPAPPAARRAVPSRALVDRFVARLAARDLPGLRALMHEGATVEEVGNLAEMGRPEFAREGSALWHAVPRHPEIPVQMQPSAWRNERVLFRGEPLVVAFDAVAADHPLMGIARFEECEGRIARIRSYVFCPETLREVAAELGVSVGPALYRFPLPPGVGSASP